MTVWRIAIDENGGYSSYSELKARRVAAIGWREIGSFATIRGQPRAMIEQFSQTNGDAAYGPVPTTSNYQWFGTPKGHPNPYGGHRMHIGRIFDYFVNQINQGDLILAHVGMPCVGIAQICPSSSYYHDPSYEYANCWGPINWVDLATAQLNVSDCRFLGICRVGEKESQNIVQRWQNYITHNNFNACQ